MALKIDFEPKSLLMLTSKFTLIALKLRTNIGCPVLRQGTSVITSTAAAAATAMFPNFYNHIPI